MRTSVRDVSRAADGEGRAAQCRISQNLARGLPTRFGNRYKTNGTNGACQGSRKTLTVSIEEFSPGLAAPEWAFDV
jgi:hypothetical protein